MWRSKVATHLYALARTFHGRGGDLIQAAPGRRISAGCSESRRGRPSCGVGGPGRTGPQAWRTSPAARGEPRPADEAEASDVECEADARLPEEDRCGDPPKHRPPRPEEERPPSPRQEAAEAHEAVPAPPCRPPVAVRCLRVPDCRRGEGLRVRPPGRPLPVPRHGAGRERPLVVPEERETAEALCVDNGTCFIAKEFRRFCEDQGICFIYGRPYNPRGGGS